MIAVNTRCLHAPTGGVQRYTKEVVERLSMPVTRLAPAIYPAGVWGHLWEQLALPGLLGGRLLWNPANSGPLLVSRQVVTIHDASPLDHPEWFERRFAAWYRLLLPALARRARHILTDSEFSKGRLLRRSAISTDKITVVYPGVSARFRPATPEETQRYRRQSDLPELYFLFVGSLEPRKNLVCLVRAWQIFHGDHPKYRLVIAGEQGSRRVHRPTSGIADAAGVRYLGRVDESDLPALYSGAVALAYPSLYEGFGLPALEAMACGVAVVAFETKWMRETGGEAVFTVRQRDETGLAQGMAQIANETKLRERLADSGLARAQQFSWEQTARQVESVLLAYA